MATRNIITEEDDTLRKISREVTEFDSRLKSLVKDLIETMRKADGLGLAAPQVGVLRRVAVVAKNEPEEEILILINPKIVATEGEQFREEGCLSIPGVYGIVKRPMKVTVETYDLKGNKKQVTVDEITAVAVCHESEHLDGILFRDKVIKYTSDDE
jgi:peptide deformylase